MRGTQTYGPPAVCAYQSMDAQEPCLLAILMPPRICGAFHRVVYMYTKMMTIRFRMVPMMPSMASTLSSLLSFSWPPRSSSFPLVITILVANVFIFLARLTEKSIRRQVGGAQGTQ